MSTAPHFTGLTRARRIRPNIAADKARIPPTCSAVSCNPKLTANANAACKTDIMIAGSDFIKIILSFLWLDRASIHLVTL